MKRRLLIAAALSVVTTTVLADMYQDASNAKLPEAKQNLELGTVRSEGGTQPTDDAVTRFYSYGQPTPKVMLEIAANPFAIEHVVEQAGLGAPGGVGVGQGATRLCTAPFSNNQVNCNYVAFGAQGEHRFANGAGFMAEMDFIGTASSNAWPNLVSSDDDVARLFAEGTHTDTALELRAKGAGLVSVGTNAGTGPLLSFFVPGGTTASKIRSPGQGVNIEGFRFWTHIAAGSYSILTDDSGKHFHNTGATGTTTFNLPAAVTGPGTPGVHFCFSVDAAFSVVVKANGTDKIAFGATNSAAGGQLSANQPYASVCIEMHKTGQWFVYATADKTQWTVT